jgi:hypothetical protein
MITALVIIFFAKLTGVNTKSAAKRIIKEREIILVSFVGIRASMANSISGLKSDNNFVPTQRGRDLAAVWRIAS